MELEETQPERFRDRSPLRAAGFRFGKGTDLTLKMHAFLKTTERSDLLSTIWNKEILPSGKKQLDTIIITDYYFKYKYNFLLIINRRHITICKLIEI